ncbi:MAG TPA: hypothetical protein VFA96_05835, partial [Nocardioides sp.]|nr:hypothetical protein [Nocardioides sp.]
DSRSADLAGDTRPSAAAADGHSSSRVTRDIYDHVLSAVDQVVVDDINELFTASRTHRAQPLRSQRGREPRIRRD